jgi:hypothetical protein
MWRRPVALEAAAARRVARLACWSPKSPNIPTSRATAGSGTNRSAVTQAAKGEADNHGEEEV